MAETNNVELIKIDRHYFWCIIDELCDDNSVFIYNRSEILKALINGNLYGLKMNESNPKYQEARSESLFCQQSVYLLPCFCIAENKKAIMLWVHSRAQKRGFGSLLVKLLEITDVYCPLDSARDFWEKCGIDV